MQLFNTHNSTDFSLEQAMKIIDIIVKKFIKSGQINYDDYDEIKQILIEKYLNKQTTIAASFSNKSKVQTYISAVIYKMLLEVLRESKNYKNKVKKTESILANDYRQTVISPEDQLVIEDEKRYLIRVFESFGPEQDKLILFLKIYFQIDFTDTDLIKYCKIEKDKIAVELEGYENKLADKDIYKILCRLHFLGENKTVMPDAIRMYINKNIERLIARMNGKNERAYYTRESLGILIEMAYQEN